MIFLPIVERELRVMSRRARTYWGRWMPVLLVVFLCAQAIEFSFVAGRPNGGFEMFAMVSGFIAFLAAFSGLAAADAISLEKREGTLGFLFLTDLTGWDIVLGKLVAAAVPSIYAAMAALPIAAMALLLGGVNSFQMWGVSLAILNLFFFSNAAAMFGSTIFRKRGNAAGFPALVIAFYVICIWMPALVAEKFGFVTIANCLNVFNPGWTVFAALAPALVTPRYFFFLSLVAVHLTAWGWIALASVLLPGRWQNKPKKAKTLRMWWDSIRFGSVERRTKLRRQLMGRNPFLWLASRGRLGPRGVWMVFACIMVFLAAFCVLMVVKEASKADDICIGLCVYSTILLQLGLRFGASGAVGASLETQRRDGSLELILCCTPLTTEDILAGEWQALRRWLMGPAIAVLGLDLALALASLHFIHRADDRGVVWFLLLACVMLAPDLWATSWVSMWAAMSSRGKGSASMAGALFVAGGPWVVIGLVCGTVMSTTNREPPSLWLMWPLAGLSTDYLLARFCRWRVKKNFRHWARLYDERLNFWGYLGRWAGRWLRRAR